MSLREDMAKVPAELWGNAYVQIKPIRTEEDLICAGFECRLTEAQTIKLATEVCNERAQSLYRSLGFQMLPEKDGNDLVFGL